MESARKNDLGAGVGEVSCFTASGLRGGMISSLFALPHFEILGGVANAGAFLSSATPGAC